MCTHTHMHMHPCKHTCTNMHGYHTHTHEKKEKYWPNKEIISIGYYSTKVYCLFMFLIVCFTIG